MHLGNGRMTHRDTFRILLISIWIVPIFTVPFNVTLFLFLYLSVYGRKVVRHWFMIMRFQIKLGKGISVVSIASHEIIIRNLSSTLTSSLLLKACQEKPSDPRTSSISTTYSKNYHHKSEY